MRLILSRWTIAAVSGKLLSSGQTGASKLFQDNFPDRITGSTGSDYFFAVRTGRFADEIVDRLASEVLAS